MKTYGTTCIAQHNHISFSLSSDTKTSILKYCECKFLLLELLASLPLYYGVEIVEDLDPDPNFKAYTSLSPLKDPEINQKNVLHYVWMNRQKFKILDDALLCCDCITGERSELVQSYGKELSFTLCKVVAEESQCQCSLFSRELSSFFLLSQTVALREHWSDNSTRRLCLHTTVQR